MQTLQKKKPKVLVVDDHNPILAALKLRLEHANYEVVVAHDNLSACVKARESNPDIALLDIDLPDGNGFDLSEKLDQLSTKTLPKVFITASKSEGLRKQAEYRGAVDFIEKPFTCESLLAAIEEAELRV
ncbi:MAG: response regulator [Pseudomonadota bacterium]